MGDSTEMPAITGKWDLSLDGSLGDLLRAGLGKNSSRAAHWREFEARHGFANWNSYSVSYLAKLKK